jgi:hypothetical protein
VQNKDENNQAKLKPKFVAFVNQEKQTHTTIFSAASQILSTLASDRPFIPVKLFKKMKLRQISYLIKTK